MNMILGLADSSWIAIGLAVFSLLTTIMGIALRASQKSGNLNTMKTMDEKFDIEMERKVKPINKRLANTELDIKDINKTIAEHTTSHAVTDSRLTQIIESLAEIKELVK